MAKKIKGEVALVDDHGQNFAVVAVSDDAVADPRMREEAIAACEDQFGDVAARDRCREEATARLQAFPFERHMQAVEQRGYLAA